MQVIIELPDTLAADLQEKWGNLPRHILQTVALAGFRRGELTNQQAAEILSLAPERESPASLEGANLPSPNTAKELTHAKVNLNATDEFLLSQLELGRKGTERIREAVKEMQGKGILDTKGRRIRTDLPPDMQPDSKANFNH